MEVEIDQAKKVVTEATYDFSFSPLQQWEVAFIYAFACTFNPQYKIAQSFYKLPDFTPGELELEIQKQDSDLVRHIICASLGNILNRKNPIESFKISLCQMVTDKMKAFEIDLDTNPLSKSEFNLLDTDVKLYLLRSLIEWQLQDSLAVKSILDYYNSNTARNQINPIKSTPIGTDAKKRNYWQFGDSCWVWREKPHYKPICEWETVCKNIQDLDKLISELSSSTNKAEKSLVKIISEDVYELAEKDERRKLRREKAELRKLMPVEVSITPTQLRSRGNRSDRVRYNYDEVYKAEEYEEYEDEEDEEEEVEEDLNDAEDDDDFEIEQEPEVRRSSRKVASPSVEKPTRWSSRLNRTVPADEQHIEEGLAKIDDMIIDSQKLGLIEETMDRKSFENSKDIATSINEMDTTFIKSKAYTVSNINTTETMVTENECGNIASAMEQ